jgi:hypothetical protein
MNEALEQIVELFRVKDWKFEVDEENDAVRTAIQGDNSDWQVMAPCAELFTRINFGMIMGCFEMDYDSGGIHFKTTLPFAQGDINTAILDKVVMINLTRMDRFLPTIMSVIYAEVSLAQAPSQGRIAIRAKAFNRNTGIRTPTVREQLIMGRGESFLTNQINALNLK